MNGNKRGVLVRILDKEFQIACPNDKEDILKKSASYLDAKMRNIRQSGRIVGLERVAIMAGISLAHELMELRDSPSDEVIEITNRLETLKSKIDKVLLENIENHDNMVTNESEEQQSLPLEDNATLE